MNKLSNIFIKNPWVRSAIPSFFAISIGVLTNSLIVEITNDGNVVWKNILFVKSFYFIAIAFIISTLYQFYIFKHDYHSSMSLSKPQFKAKIRATYLKQYQNYIQKGQWDKFDAAGESLRRIINSY
jgi:hypothetical protein